MLCTTVSDRQYGQQLAGSTIGQMDSCALTHADCLLFMKSEAYSVNRFDKLHQKLQSDFRQYGCYTNTHKVPGISTKLIAKICKQKMNN